MDVFTGEIDGVPAAFVMPAIHESYPERVREGLARRRISASTGVCPCGGRLRGLSRAQRRQLQRRKRSSDPSRVLHVRVVHQDDCPAIAEDTVAAAAGRRWSR